jgi:hypothetical protein
MARIDDLVAKAIKQLPEKPPEDSASDKKKRFSELVSAAFAVAFAEELRKRGLREARPSPPGIGGKSGAERRMSGGIGAKKVDVTWATEESGLLLGISIKSINWRDRRAKNFQKNLINRRGDMLIEAVTLHRRFPYAVLSGFFILDKEAAEDQTQRRRSTFQNAHSRLRLFTHRNDPAGRDEQYERLYLCLLDANKLHPTFDVYAVGSPDTPLSLEAVFDDLVNLVGVRDPDFYEALDGKLRRL